MARRRARGHSLDIFVVLSDVLMSLAFILLLFGFSATLLATNNWIKSTKRDRQLKIMAAIVDSIRKEPELARLKLFEGQGATRKEVANISDSESNNWHLETDHEVGSIQFNSSYMRIRVYDDGMFGEDGRLRSSTGYRQLRAIAHEVARHSLEIEYLQLQGICEEDDSVFAGKDRSLSEQMAVNVLSELRTLGVVTSTKTNSSKSPAGSEERVQGMFVDRFVETYGTGRRLYPKPELAKRRVDIVLFFNENENDGQQPNRALGEFVD